MDKDTIELILIGIIALSVALQSIFLIVLVVTLGKAVRAVSKEFDSLRASILPIIHNTRDVIARVSPKIEAACEDTREIITRVKPKIEAVSEDIKEMTHSIGNQVAEVQAAASEMTARAKHLAERLDHMSSTVLNRVDQAADFVSGTVSKPVRQVSGVLASVRAIVETLRHYDPSARRRPPVPARSAD